MNNQPPMQAPPQPPMNGSPVPPSAPQQMPQNQMQMQPQMPGQKSGNKKGLIIGLIAGGVALVLLIVGVVLALTVFGKPSTKDYTEAVDEFNTISTQYNKAATSSSFYYSSVTETEAKNTAESLKKAKTSVNEGLEKLKDMKAVKGDSEVKAKYDAVEEQIDAFNVMVDAYIEAYDTILPVFNSAQISSANSDSAINSISTMRSKLEGIQGSIKNEYNKQFVTDEIAALKEYETAAKAYVDYLNDYTKYTSGLSKAYYDASDKVSDVASDWGSNLEKLADEGDIKDKMNSLGTLLMQKQYS